MAEMVIGEKVSLEEMGGARMHCSVSPPAAEGPNNKQICGMRPDSFT
jgi:acetyl-CoA carboxylase carboxyltransferase component